MAHINATNAIQYVQWFVGQQVADRDRAKGLVGPRGELLRNKRPVQMHLHTSASPRVFMERNGAQRDSMHEHVNRKAAWAVPPTPRAYAAEPLLPRNLVDTEDDEAPKPMTSHSVFARPNRLRYGDAMRYVHKIEVKRHEIKQRPVTVRTGLALNTAMLMNVPQPKGDWAPNSFRTVSGASSTAQGSARS
eukprot:Tamp_26113.p1 GENE.Tamp_26113~~Tamp_26113.p1  ORF type:complete len:201 (-),score=34.42 Tamp_26113:308-877(-)